MSSALLRSFLSLFFCLALGCGGSTAPEPLNDCSGVPDGEAYVDGCGTCVGGDTGLTACAEDCNGDFGGTAEVDACGVCAGGETGTTACVADCNGDFGGTAEVDTCGVCAGGETGTEACVADCNGDFGGTAEVDGCGVCAGGETGVTACVADCNGDLGGTAVLDGCGTCVGGQTGLGFCAEACGADRLDELGTRYLSLTTFHWAHPMHYSVEETDESLFGMVKHALSFLFWLEIRRDIDLPEGRWALDVRLMPSQSFNWDLGASPEAEACGAPSWMSWVSPFGASGRWQLSPEKLLLDTSDACSVQLTLRETAGSSKEGSRLDWVRIRHACSVDADCPEVEGSPLAVCRSEVCRYYDACLTPE